MKKNIEKGFTLIEVLLAIVLIALAIAALVASSTSFTQITGSGAELSTAEFLIEQIRELTILLPVIDPDTGTTTFGHEEAALSQWDDLDDFDEADFSPPINADRTTLTDLLGYSQQITVENLNPSDFEQTIADHGSNFVKVSVKILLNSKEISSADWVRARY